MNRLALIVVTTNEALPGIVSITLLFLYGCCSNLKLNQLILEACAVGRRAREGSVYVVTLALRF